MFGLAKSDDYQPITWVGRYPVHVATLLVILHVLTMIGTAVAIAFEQQLLLLTLAFSSSEVLGHAALWQFVTYAFVNGPSIWFAVEMFLLFSFGREVERFIGRRAFIALYAMLLLLPPCLLTAIGPFVSTRFVGSGSLHFAIFVAFATIYPNVDLLFTVKAKWVAGVLLAIYSLQAFAGHEWTLLLVLWASAAAAFVFITWLRRGGEFELPNFLKVFSRKPKFSVVKPQRAQKKAEEDVMESIDPLLEKISKHGLGSLTPKERLKLERASSALIKKPR